MLRTIALAFLAFAMIMPFLFRDEADAQNADAFTTVVDQKTAQATGAIGSFRDQLLADHNTIMDQNNKIAELTKELEALKAEKPKVQAPAVPVSPSPPASRTPTPPPQMPAEGPK